MLLFNYYVSFLWRKPEVVFDHKNSMIYVSSYHHTASYFAYIFSHDQLLDNVSLTICCTKGHMNASLVTTYMIKNESNDRPKKIQIIDRRIQTTVPMGDRDQVSIAQTIPKCVKKIKHIYVRPRPGRSYHSGSLGSSSSTNSDSPVSVSSSSIGSSSSRSG